MAIQFIDCSTSDAREHLVHLRDRLSPRGDIVSEKGRQRTRELFGEALSPEQVVKRILEDVRREGLSAVLRYTEKLDNKILTPETLRVPPRELESAHSSASEAYLGTLRRIVENIRRFQESILNLDVSFSTKIGGGKIELQQRYLPLRRVGICALKAGSS